MRNEISFETKAVKSGVEAVKVRGDFERRRALDTSLPLAYWMDHRAENIYFFHPLSKLNLAAVYPRINKFYSRPSVLSKP